MVSLKSQYGALIKLGLSRSMRKGYHKHRVIPGYDGGEYISGNIAYLTRVEHIKVHRLRYKLIQDHRDLLACKLLGDILSDVEWTACASAGGLMVGNNHKKNKTGVCGRSRKQMSVDGKKGSAAISIEMRRRGGLIAGALLFKTKRGIFGIPPEQDRINRAKGGSIAGKLLSHHDRIKGFIGTRWVTDGVSNIRLKSNARIPTGFYLGRARNFNAVNFRFRTPTLTEGI